MRSGTFCRVFVVIHDLRHRSSDTSCHAFGACIVIRGRVIIIRFTLIPLGCHKRVHSGYGRSRFCSASQCGIVLNGLQFLIVALEQETHSRWHTIGVECTGIAIAEHLRQAVIRSDEDKTPLCINRIAGRSGRLRQTKRFRLSERTRFPHCFGTCGVRTGSKKVRSYRKCLLGRTALGKNH